METLSDSFSGHIMRRWLAFWLEDSWYLNPIEAISGNSVPYAIFRGE